MTHGAVARAGRLREAWRDPSLTMLLIVQCLTIFVLIPASAVGVSLPLALASVLQLTFTSLTILAARRSWTLWAGVISLVLAGCGPVVRYFYDVVYVQIGNDLIAVATHALLIVVVFSAVFGPGRFTGHRIRGTIVLYFNTAILFALLHRVVAESCPGAYTHLPDFHDGARFRAATDYFSFSTLTSLGYGDITPVQPFARSLSTLEAVIGQVFPATLLARAVTLAAAGSSRGKSSNADDE